MFGTVLDKVTSLFDQRFLVGLLMPVMAFGGGVLALVATAIGWSPTLAWGRSLDGVSQILLVVAFVAAAVFSAILFGTQVLGLTRLLEGYWPGWLRGPLQTRYKKAFRTLDQRSAQDVALIIERYQRFPIEEKDVMPTALGNVLRAAERYSGDTERWGLDAVFWWPRLYLVLPEAAREQVDDARSSMDQMVVLAAVVALFSVTSLGFSGSVPLSVWLPCAGGSVVLSWLTYRAAISAALVFGELVRSSYDLYRSDLLDRLGWDMPKRWKDEVELWQTLQQQLLRRGVSDDALDLSQVRRG